MLLNVWFADKKLHLTHFFEGVKIENIELISGLLN